MDPPLSRYGGWLVALLTHKVLREIPANISGIRQKLSRRTQPVKPAPVLRGLAIGELEHARCGPGGRARLGPTHQVRGDQNRVTAGGCGVELQLEAAIGHKRAVPNPRPD